MKPFIFYACAIGLILCACSDDKEELNSVPPRYYLEDTSYIQGYSYGDPKLLFADGTRDSECDLLTLFVSTDTENTLCASPYYLEHFDSYLQQSDEETAKFLATAEANGDLHYTGWAGDLYWAFAQHLQEIHLSCDHDWDAVHPAGDSLDDVFYFNGSCYKSFLESGYSDACYSNIDRRCKIDCLTPDDLYITEDYFFLQPPRDRCPLFGEEVTFFLKVVLSDGREVDSQYTVRPEDWKDQVVH